MFKFLRNRRTNSTLQDSLERATARNVTLDLVNTNLSRENIVYREQITAMNQANRRKKYALKKARATLLSYRTAIREHFKGFGDVMEAMNRNSPGWQSRHASPYEALVNFIGRRVEFTKIATNLGALHFETIMETPDEDHIKLIQYGVKAGRTAQVWHLDPGATTSDQGAWCDIEGEPAFSCPAHLYRLKPQPVEPEVVAYTNPVYIEPVHAHAINPEPSRPQQAQDGVDAAAYMAGTVVAAPDPNWGNWDGQSSDRWAGQGGESGGAGASASWSGNTFESPSVSVDFSDVSSSVSSTESPASSD